MIPSLKTVEFPTAAQVNVTFKVAPKVKAKAEPLSLFDK